MFSRGVAVWRLPFVSIVVGLATLSLRNSDSLLILKLPLGQDAARA